MMTPENITKQVQEGIERVKGMVPQVTFNKNGYEIRTEILKEAKDLVQAEYEFKLHGWEVSQTKNSDGSITTTVGMPEVPGLDKVLETAERMYAFVSQGTTASTKSTKK